MSTTFQPVVTYPDMEVEKYNVRFTHGAREIGWAEVALYDDGWCGLWSVRIAEDERGHGYGTVMVQEVIEFLKSKRRFKGLYLYADPGREAWYERLGFVAEYNNPSWRTKYVMEF